MEEAEASDAELGNVDKKTNSVLLGGDELTSLRRSNPTLSPQFVALMRNDGMNLEDVNGLCIEDVSSSPVNAQLSPAGLISIAAADIDEAATNTSQNIPPVNGQLDLAFIRLLRQKPTAKETTEGLDVMTTALRQVIGTLPAARRSLLEETAVDTGAVNTEANLFSLVRRHLRMLRSASFMTSTSADENKGDAVECQSKLRFLSLLRRINELRSQQVDTESWDGVPYPQILALPTFQYQVREHHAKTEELEEGSEVNNTVCTVCCDEFEAEEEVRALPCLHFYHRECIDQWLMYHRQCPICKHVVAVY